MLQLCMSGPVMDTPYVFKSTGIRVYSIEEALYHSYYYWRESLDDFGGDSLFVWVESFAALDLTPKIREISALKPLSKRLVAFVQIIAYFDPSELMSLKSDLEKWENTVEWEKLKNRADSLVSRGEPTKALPLYRRAIKYDEANAILLNNMAVACMKLGDCNTAVDLLARACEIEPDNQDIAMHYAEALVLAGLDLQHHNHFHETKEASSHITNGIADIDAAYLRGLAAYQQGDYPTALEHFTLCGDKYKIADTYLKMRQYDKALATLDPSEHEKIAEIYAAYGHAHLPEAIRHIRQAIAGCGGHGETALYTKLARYYRMDYDWQRASEAIAKALPSNNPTALLENARIKKGLGRMRDYRTGLSSVLQEMKNQYRPSDR